MKLQSPTLILVFIAIALGSFVAVTELRPTDSSDGGESQSLFEFEEKEVRSLVVETASQTLIFEKEEFPTDSAESDSAESDNAESDNADLAEPEKDKQTPESENGDGVTEDTDVDTFEADPSEPNTSEAEAKESDTKKPDTDTPDDDLKTSNVDNESDSKSDDSDTDESTPETSTNTQEDSDAGNQPEAISEWWMRSPDEAPADDSAVIFLVNLMASGVSDRVFDVEPENLGDFGFDSPLAEVEVILENNESHRLILGNYDFNGTNIYAQIISTIDDSEVESSEVESSEAESSEAESSEAESSESSANETESETVDVFIVSTSFDAAVNRPLEKWKHVEDDNSEEDAELL